MMQSGGNKSFAFWVLLKKIKALQFTEGQKNGRRPSLATFAVLGVLA